MQLKNVMHLNINTLFNWTCKIPLIYGKNVVQRNEVHKNFSQLPEKSKRTFL